MSLTGSSRSSPTSNYGAGMMDPGEIRVDRFGNRFGTCPALAELLSAGSAYARRRGRKDDWRHYMQQLGERGRP
eukprot:3854170-Prymnesium_polylepis.1